MVWKPGFEEIGRNPKEWEGLALSQKERLKRVDHVLDEIRHSVKRFNDWHSPTRQVVFQRYYQALPDDFPDHFEPGLDDRVNGKAR